MSSIEISYLDLKQQIPVVSCPTYDVLVGIAKSMFENLPEELVLKYHDDEGDLVCIKSDLELQESYRLMIEDGDSNLLKIIIAGNGEELPAVCEKEKNDALPSEDLKLLEEVEEQLNYVLNVMSHLVSEYQIKEHWNSVVELCDRGLENASSSCKETLLTVKEFVQAQSQGFSFEKQLEKLKDELRHLAEQIRLQVSEAFSSIAAHSGPYPASANSVSQSSASSSEVVVPPADPLLDSIEASFEVVPSPEAPKDDTATNSSNKPEDENISISSPNDEVAVKNPVNVVTTVTVDHESNEVPAPESVEDEPADKIPDPSGTNSSDGANSDLKQLEVMGFKNREQNIALLLKHDGDLVAVVEELLSSEQ